MAYTRPAMSKLSNVKKKVSFDQKFGLGQVGVGGGANYVLCFVL